MKRNLFFLLAIFLLILLGMQILLPSMAERKIKRTMIENINEYQELKIKASAFPAWKILFSRLDFLKISGTEVKLNDINLKSIKASYRNISYSRGEILGENTDFKIVLTAADLNEYLEENYDGLNDYSIHLLPGQVFLQGSIILFDARINLELSGNFSIEKKSRVYFNPERFKIEEISIPSTFLKTLIAEMDFYFDLNQLSIPINLEEIKISEDSLVLLGGLSVRKAGLN